MSHNRARTVKSKRIACALVLLVLLNGLTLGLETIADDAADQFTATYSALTKEALIAGIELERFNLNYRLASVKQPKWRTLRYSIGQEAGSAGILAFEVTGDKQFDLGRKNPAKVSQNALRGALIDVVPTSAVAGASSCFELGSNFWQARRNKKLGLDPRSARQSALTRFRHLEEVLEKREAFVEAHKNHPAYDRAAAEGAILQDLRKAEIDEFAHYYSNARGSAVSANTFYVLNAITNALGATAGGVAFRSVNQPKFSADADILFTLAGSFGAISPWLSARAAAFAARQAWKSVANSLDASPAFDPAKLAEHRAKLNQVLAASQGSLVPSLPAVDRLALYTQSGELFKKQLESEISTSRHLARVALQQELLAPLIGGTLATQGIVGTVGYYRYGSQPRKQFGLYYGGSITGTAGGALATAATAAALLASWSHERSLEQRDQAPKQLIMERLRHLDEVEKIIQAI
jgi:hypothetical protein